MGARTKSLLLIFALLTLLRPASSLIDHDQMEELKGNIQKLQKEAARKRTDNMLENVFCSDIFGELDAMMEFLFKQFKGTISGFPMLQEVLEELKAYMGELMIYVLKDQKKKDAEFRDHEEQLRQLERLITSLAD